MNRTAANRAVGVVGAEHHRICAVANALAGPIELLLMRFVRSKILEWTPPGPGVEPDDREAGLGQTARERPAAGACPGNREIYLLIIAIYAHRGPGAHAKRVGCAAVLASRHPLRIIRHGRFPERLRPRGRVGPRRLPTDRGGRNPFAHSRAGSPGRRSRSRSMRSDARSRL
jgi:hypothetical protein